MDNIINIEISNISATDEVLDLFSFGFNIPIKVSITPDAISYSELISELTNQPYILDTMSVFADTSEQVTQQLTKIKRTPNGTSKTEVEYPKIDPNQFQFVLNNIKLDFTPSPVSKLQYTIKANQTVNLWFYFRKINTLDMLENKKPLLMQKGLKESTKINIIKMNKVNPLISLTKPKKRTIKEIVKSNSTLRDITQISDEEVFNAFDETDFTK